MPKRRIFTVGFGLPGEEFEYIEFDSDQTLLDADIILYLPTLGHCSFEYGQEWAGKPVLSHSSSFSTKGRLDHWCAEIIAAVNAGKMIVVYLAKPIEYCRYTGERQYSGTGRSRVQTNIVANISSYDAVPNIKRVTAKTGSSIRFEKDAIYLAPYWNEFANLSHYEVEIDGEFNRILLRSQAGNRIIGAAYHAKSGGVLLCLPPLQYDEGEFVRGAEQGEDKSKKYWTTEAIKFGKRFVLALVELSETLHSSSRVTPPPTWSLRPEFRLDRESELESKISACSAKITKLQVDKAELERQLADVGDLRRLLFEQGKPLEHVVLEAMKVMGFDARPFSDGGSEFDGIFISPEGRCLGEVEGKDNKAINIEKFSQLERNLQEDFARDNVTEYAKGLLFGNAFRLKPIVERDGFFTDKCMSAAKRINAALIRTPDLFAPVRFLKEHPNESEYAKACREAIFSANGLIVVFPEPPERTISTLMEASSAEQLPPAKIEAAN